MGRCGLRSRIENRRNFEEKAPRHSHTVVPLAPRIAGRIGRPQDLEADVG